MIGFFRNFLELVRVSWHYAGWQLVLLGLVTFLATGLEAFGISMLLPLLNATGQSETTDPITQAVFAGLQELGIEPSLGPLLLLLVLVFLFKGLGMFAASSMTVWITANVRQQLQLRLAQLIEQARFVFYAKASSGYLVNLVGRECDRFGSVMQNLVKGMVVFVSTLVFLTAVFSMKWSLALILIGSGVLILFSLRFLVAKTRHYSIAISELYAGAQTVLIQIVRNFTYLKATDSAGFLRAHFNDDIEKLTRLQKRIGMISAFLETIKEPIGILLLAAIVFLEVAVNGQPLGEVMVFGLLFYRMIQQLLSLQNNWQRVNVNIGGVLAVQGGIAQLEAAAETNPGTLPARLNQSIHVEDVSVQFAGTAALSRVSLVLHPNRTYGIVGPSGAGKSTLFNVLTGLLPPDEGRIRLGEDDYRGLDMASLRQQIGFVSQAPAMFNTSLIENITFWRAEAEAPETRERVALAARRAGCEDLLQRGDEAIGEDGNNLSGGQKQRVAIARELLKDPPLIIFDEATSALDSHAEAAIQASISAMKGRRTILIIAHRLSTVRDCDSIFVLDKGHLVQQGCFEALWQEGQGLFRSMCDYQGLTLESASRSAPAVAALDAVPAQESSP